MSKMSKSAVLDFGKRFASFVDASPTPFHCVEQTVKRLENVGFTRLREAEPFAGQVQRGGKYYYTRNEGMIVAFAVGQKYEAGNAFKVVGAHTDSPALKLKPVSKRPNSHGYVQVGAETYGGGLWFTWLDRDLGIAGRAIVKTGENAFASKLVHIKKPIMRIPSLCIHLQSAAERKALEVNKEEHLVPILGIINETLNSPCDERHTPELMQELAKEIACDPKDIVDLELTLCDTQPAQIGGVNNEFVFSPRLDNQIHCFTSIEALVNHCESGLADDKEISVVALFDHEEVGSGSTTGAGSPVMRDAVVRISACFEPANNPAQAQELFKIALQKSLLWSADGAHAVHPNFASKHEKQHCPHMGKGTVIKTNDNQRYATNAITGFIVREVARKTGTMVQEFVVKNNCPCGSTIGPIIAANTGIRTVDIGVPQLSMHSIRETCCTYDVYDNTQLLTGFFKHAIAIDESITYSNY